MINLIYLLVAAALGFALGRYRDYSFQNRGEARLTRSLQRHFATPDYHLMNNVTLCLQDGTTQIDHILVSRYGVFVIDTKDYTGWIFGDPKQSKWTQVIYRRKFRFQNPLFQNHKHVCAVRDTLEFLPPGAIKAAVVFTGDAKFKTPLPEGVFNITSLVNYVSGQTEELMSLNRMQFCVGRLESVRLALTQTTDIEHVRSLQRRHAK